ncbi:MAG: hypothetical protein ACYDHD_04670 [Vulcanimicrobiaceae bacterium]
MLKLRIPAAILAIALLSTAAASAQSVLTLYKGAQITAQMNNTISTGSAHVGDQFTMNVVPPYPSGNPAYAGATVTGQVVKVIPAGQGRKPVLQLQFESLRLSDGTIVGINASMASTPVNQKQELRNGGRVALTTVGGMILGNIIGKTIFHTGGGGLLGAAGGFLYGYNMKSNVQLPAGSMVTLNMNRTVVIRRQASRPY